MFFISDEQCSSLRIEQSGTGAGVPPITLLSSLFSLLCEHSEPTCALCLMNYALKSGAGVPAHHSSLFTILYSLRESFFHANRPLCNLGPYWQHRGPSPVQSRPLCNPGPLPCAMPCATVLLFIHINIINFYY